MAEARTSEDASGPPRDERAHERYEGKLEASLLVEGGRWRCWICDISPGGAGLEPEIPAALGKRVALSSPFFEFEGELPARVVNVADQRTCLAFDLDSELRDKLESFLKANTATP